MSERGRFLGSLVLAAATAGACNAEAPKPTHRSAESYEYQVVFHLTAKRPGQQVICFSDNLVSEQIGGGTKVSFIPAWCPNTGFNKQLLGTDNPEIPDLPITDTNIVFDQVDIINQASFGISDYSPSVKP